MTPFDPDYTPLWQFVAQLRGLIENDFRYSGHRYKKLGFTDIYRQAVNFFNRFLLI